MSQADLDTIQEINLSQTSITTGKTNNLAGIEYLNNLTKLSLYETEVTDLSILSNNLALTYLNVSNGPGITHAKLEDSGFGAVGNLTNLETLIVSGQKITNLQPLRNLTKLKMINVESNTDFVDASGIEASVSTLENFRGSYTMIADLTPFTGAVNLTSLVLFDSNVSDLAPLATCTSLESLQVVGGAINGSGGVKDVTPLQNLVNLKSVGLRYNAISDIEQFTTGFTNVTTFQLKNQVAKSTVPVKVSSVGAASMETFVKNESGALITPSSVYDAGSFDGTSTIQWSGGLTTTDTLVGYAFSTTVTLNGIAVAFSGDAYADALHPQPLVFDSNGGTPVTTTGDYYAGDFIVEPSMPTNADLYFNGWYLDNGTFANPWNFAIDTIPAGGVTLYAQWSAPQTITWHFHDGEIVPQVDNIVENDSILLTTPIRVGYVFDGWYHDKDTFIEPVSAPYIVPANIAGTNTDFHAKWVAEETSEENNSLVATGERTFEIAILATLLIIVGGLRLRFVKKNRQ